MNHDELEELINRLSHFSLELDNEISKLQSLQRIREATRNTGARPTPDYATYETQYGDGEFTGREEPEPEKRKAKLKIGDHVTVLRGKNQGVHARIIKETPAQYELLSDQVEGTFRKWKNNVKRARNRG